MREQSLKRIEYFDHVTDPNAPWVILFHGFGADAHDLEGLKDYIHTNKPVNFRFPNGIYEVPIGPGWTGRAWWKLTLNSLPHDWSDHTPDEMASLVPSLIKMISDLNVPWNKIILGGFSQGAMLATELYLQAPETPLGLISMSGSLIR
ncbi:MAG: alpha/beta hydrolase, partial [Pseudobdellovibrio sp.]